MKDKEKQIEELAQCKNSSGYTCGSCGVKHACDRYLLAKEIYDKDSIVLSREEYSELKGRAEEVFNEMTERMKAEVKIAKKIGVVKGSKETAEKIFAKEREFIYSKWKSYITMNDLIEIAKQFGVEIKE